MKAFTYITCAVFAVCSVVVFVSVLWWGVSLPQTAILWHGGVFSGWCNLIILAVIFSGFPLSIALVEWDIMRTENRYLKRA